MQNFSKAIEVYPAAEFLADRGDFYYDIGVNKNHQEPEAFEKALHDYDSAIRLDEKNKDYYRKRALIKGKLEHWHGVISDSDVILNKIGKRARRGKPESLFLKRGIAKKNLGDFEGALNDFKIYYEKSILRRQSNLETRFKYNYYAEVYEGMGNFSDAIENYLEFLKWSNRYHKDDQLNREVFKDIARNYSKLGDQQKADEYNKKAL